MGSSDTQNEQGWLNHLQAECDSVMQQCRLPGDRAATEAEMKAFHEGLNRLEASCRAMQPTAAIFDSVGLHTLSQRLTTVLQDIAGARNALAQPPSRAAGPATQRAEALRRQQNEVSAFSTAAMQMVNTDPAGAETMLVNALGRTAQVFQAQKEFLQDMAWGAAELARLDAERADGLAVLHAALGEAAIRLGKYQDARRWYQAALAELGPAPHPAKPSMQMALAQITMLEANRARQ